MISKTKINKRMKKKTNSELVEALYLAKKNNLLELAKFLSAPARKRIKINLEGINQQTKEGDSIIVPGKVLGDGDINKKIKITAFNFSSSAQEKLKKAKCELKLIREELKKSKKLDGKILTTGIVKGED